MAGKVTAGLAESNGSLPLVDDLVTCGLTACGSYTGVSSGGETLSNEYGKPLPVFN